MTGLSVLVSRLPTGIIRGQPVTIHDGRLSVLATAGGSGAAISLVATEELALFSGSISDAVADRPRPALCEQLALIREAILAHGSPDGLRDLADGIATTMRRGPASGASQRPAGALPPSFSAFSRRALNVIRTMDDDRSSIDLSGLVGLGVGFTPSGDDFICGALAAADAVRAAVSQPALDIEPILGRLRTTTLAGATLLSLACTNSFPAYLVQFVRQLIESKMSGIEDAVHIAIGHGATSGTDALVGFLWMLGSLC